MNHAKMIPFRDYNMSTDIAAIINRFEMLADQTSDWNGPENQECLIDACVARDLLLQMTLDTRINDYHCTSQEYQSTLAADVIQHLELATSDQICALLQGNLSVFADFQPFDQSTLEQIYQDLSRQRANGTIHDLRSFYQYLFITYPDRVSGYAEMLQYDLHSFYQNLYKRCTCTFVSSVHEHNHKQTAAFLRS